MLGPAQLDKGKGIMVDQGGQSEPYLGLPWLTGQGVGGNPEAARDLSDDSSSDESIFLGGSGI